MNELEAKVLEVDVAAVVRRLSALGMRAGPRRLQRRFVYDVHPRDQNKWVRLRTNGSTTTLAVKTISAATMDGVREVETEVADFDGMAAVLVEMGFTPRGYQENWRTEYTLPGVDISIDEWPGIPAYLEIEATSAELVVSTARTLGFIESELRYANTVEVYASYGIDLMAIRTLHQAWRPDELNSVRGNG